jgi:hypothetical protein
MSLDPGLILQALQNTQSIDHDVRIEAEHALDQFSKHPNYAVALAQIAVAQNSNVHFAFKQLAAVILKRYVHDNWEHMSEENKKILRDNLPVGLTDANTKITTAVVSGTKFVEFTMCEIEYDYG